ncbi:dimethylsulfonioproprionate lyase family protein [Frigidibacter sp. RF13]|uniref:dimethylsulfonioproprionate lyase family protein n=1 Tax=Frigidibacter sp. RF13 TaxID=2997340 RepID=UPI00226DEF9E|nr:dimethylsulfonioproprionate lyase family protein [Frigidibacter sp. RF13]MCY1128089.1 dimethylsulfonioproprionate lyase family protein [Frigidibacter sp. RF13]
MSDAEEDQRQFLHLTATLGEPGSGRRRYAAAMHFNRRGLLSDGALEVYRICSARDGEDPGALLKARGLLGEVPVQSRSDGALAIRRLIAEADHYLAGLDGPGLAEVRQGLAHWRDYVPRARPGPANKIVDRWLAPALGSLTADFPGLSAAIAAAAPHLDWITYDLYDPELIGADFMQGHAFASLVGEAAPVKAEDWDMGLFLIAPHVLYRDHRHRAPELYAPLTGPHGWRFGVDRPLTILPAHRPVWNEPFRPHLTKVGPEPFLCLFVWTRDVNDPAEVLAASDWPELEAVRIKATE